MFNTVQLQMHATNQKLEGNVWEMCVKKSALKKINFQCFTAFQGLRFVSYYAFVYAHCKNYNLQTSQKTITNL